MTILKGYIESATGGMKRLGMANMAKALMAGDPERFKAGYSAENALLAVIERAEREGIAVTQRDAKVVAEAIGADPVTLAVERAIEALPNPVQLGWGCNRGLPEGGVAAAYGERKIAPFDRGRADWQGEAPQLVALEEWLNGSAGVGERRDGSAPIDQARETALRLGFGRGADTMYGAGSEHVTSLYEDDRGKIVGSPQGSHGYVYIAAWLKAHELAPVTA